MSLTGVTITTLLRIITNTCITLWFDVSQESVQKVCRWNQWISYRSDNAAQGEHHRNISQTSAYMILHAVWQHIRIYEFLATPPFIHMKENQWPRHARTWLKQFVKNRSYPCCCLLRCVSRQRKVGIQWLDQTTTMHLTAVTVIQKIHTMCYKVLIWYLNSRMQ